MKSRVMPFVILVLSIAVGVLATIFLLPDLTMEWIGIPDPVTSLQSSDRNLSHAAAGVVAERGEDAAEAIPVLAEILFTKKPGKLDTDFELRWLSTHALTKMGPAAVPTLARVSCDSLYRFVDSKSQKLAVLALNQVDPALKAQALADLLQDPDERVRQIAGQQLEAMGEAANGAVPILVRICQQSDGVEVGFTGKVLEKIGAPVVPALCLAIRVSWSEAGNPRAVAFRQRAYQILMRIGPPAHEAIPTLRQAVEKDMGNAAHGFADRARQEVDLAAIPEWIDKVKSVSVRDRTSAIAMLGKLGPRAKDAVPQLLEALRDKNPSIRSCAAEALVEVGGPVDPVLAALVGLLDTQDGENALNLLERLGPRAGAAAPAIREAKAKPGPCNLDPARIEYALWQIDPVELPMLVDTLKTDTFPRADHAEAALLKHGTQAVPLLIQTLTAGNPRQRQKAAYLLGEIRPVTPPALQTLIAALDDESEQRRLDAAYALSLIGPPAGESTDALLRAANFATKDHHKSLILDHLAEINPDAAAETTRDRHRLILLAVLWFTLAVFCGWVLWLRSAKTRVTDLGTTQTNSLE